MKLKNYQDYYLQISSDTALSMTFVGLLMDGIGEYVVWGVVAAATVLFLVRLTLLVCGKAEPSEAPPWVLYPKMLIAAAFGFLFFVRDEWTASIVCFGMLCLLMLARIRDIR